MCASLKIVNPPAGSKQAGLSPDVNGPCQARPSNTPDKLDRAGPHTPLLSVRCTARVTFTILISPRVSSH